MAATMDPLLDFFLNIVLPLAAGLLISLLVLWLTRRNAFTVLAMAALLLVLFGPLSIAGALLGAAGWLAFEGLKKKRTPKAAAKARAAKGRRRRR